MLETERTCVEEKLENSPGSSKLLPINLLRDPTVFLKLEVSAVLAASPMYRCRAVKEMRELEEGEEKGSKEM